MYDLSDRGRAGAPGTEGALSGRDHTRHRARVVPRTRAAAAGKAVESGEASASDRHRSLSWAQRLKRVFAIDIEVCRRCSGQLWVIARILGHLGGEGERSDPAHPSRGGGFAGMVGSIGRYRPGFGPVRRIPPLT